MRYFDRTGRPISKEQWAAKFRDRKYAIIRRHAGGLHRHQLGRTPRRSGNALIVIPGATSAEACRPAMGDA